MACYSATISGCPNVDPVGIVYGVSTPSGQLGGTIVMLPGDGGVQVLPPFEQYIPVSISDSGYSAYTGYLGSQGL